jgi:riboflavin synthase
MFTGLIRELGKVEAIETGPDGARLRVRADLARDLGEGDSISVDGACLTAAARDQASFEADVMNQTLALTTLGSLEPGAGVNLEPALVAGAPLGGHFVQGHVDGVGEVAAVTPDGSARRLRVTLSGELARYVVERGSIALAGVSLTVSAIGDGWAEVSLIPETLARTTLGAVEPGSRLNVELDILARYAERAVQRFRKEV